MSNKKFSTEKGKTKEGKDHKECFSKKIILYIIEFVSLKENTTFSFIINLIKQRLNRWGLT
jgi:hypothetical protein